MVVGDQVLGIPPWNRACPSEAARCLTDRNVGMAMANSIATPKNPPTTARTITQGFVRRLSGEGAGPGAPGRGDQPGAHRPGSGGPGGARGGAPPPAGGG